MRVLAAPHEGRFSYAGRRRASRSVLLGQTRAGGDPRSTAGLCDPGAHLRMIKPELIGGHEGRRNKLEGSVLRPLQEDEVAGSDAERFTHFLRCPALRMQRAQAQRGVAFCEAGAGFVGHFFDLAVFVVFVVLAYFAVTHFASAPPPTPAAED